MEERYGWRARIGIISPGLAITQTREWASVLPQGISFHTTLMELVRTVPEELPRLKERALSEARKLTITGLIDLLLFSCTSGSFIGGVGYDREITRELESLTGVPSTTTSTCLLGAFQDMNIKKIALIGPYVREVLDIEIEFFRNNGIETVYCQGLGLEKVEQIIRTSEQPYTYYRVAKEAHRKAPDADAIFVTCMASPILQVVGLLEQEIGKPVISSCSGILYGALKMLRIAEPLGRYGRLLEIPR